MSVLLSIAANTSSCGAVGLNHDGVLGELGAVVGTREDSVTSVIRSLFEKVEKSGQAVIPRLWTFFQIDSTVRA